MDWSVAGDGRFAVGLKKLDATQFLGHNAGADDSENQGLRPVVALA